ncbi:galactoside alpha-(1,2)-fucosyltransferase 2-like [Babylonia areolata]|uniref:galactoside alpha-(1,2)-fucosyltransferase 2-like n=1 Tax=Babylonia areolata TaxID=304850 RepID=UPI003FD6618B
MLCFVEEITYSRDFAEFTCGCVCVCMCVGGCWFPYSLAMKKRWSIPTLFLTVLVTSLLLSGIYFIFTILYNPQFMHVMHNLARVRSDLESQSSLKGSPLRGLFSGKGDHSSTTPRNQSKSETRIQAESGSVKDRDKHGDDQHRIKPVFASSRDSTPSAYLNTATKSDSGEQNHAVIFANQSAPFQKNERAISSSSKAEGRSELSTYEQNPNGKTQSDTYYLIRGFTGRLGNVLFEFASAFCIAKLNNLTLVVRDVKPLRDLRYQGIRADAVLWEQLRALPLKAHSAATCCAFDSRIMTLKPPTSHHSLHGYLQSWKYFQPCEAEVRRVTLFNDNVTDRALTIVRDLRNKFPQRTLVGVHVRTGDYLHARSIRNGKKVAPSDYYHRAMTYFRFRFRDVTFVVITSNPPQFRQMMNASSDVVVLGWSDSAAVDMEVLSRMDHVIVSVGTFGWWAGYKNNGIVVCYKDFYVPQSKYGRQMWNDAMDFFYPGWILL